MTSVVAQFVQDLRNGLRGLLRSRSFLMTTVMTLAFGLALIGVAFTVVEAYVLRPYAVLNLRNFTRSAGNLATPADPASGGTTTYAGYWVCVVANAN